MCLRLMVYDDDMKLRVLTFREWVGILIRPKRVFMLADALWRVATQRGNS